MKIKDMVCNLIERLTVHHFHYEVTDHFCQFARAPDPVDGVVVAVAESTAHSRDYRSPGRSFSCESGSAPRSYKI